MSRATLAPGEEQGAKSSPDKSAPQAEQESASKQFETQPAQQGDQKAPAAIDFVSFFMSLATQALMQLGEMEAPAGVAMTKDLDAAQQTIDILSMLQEKTRGNLSEQEDKLVEEVLHNLRMVFLKVKGEDA